MKKIKVLLSLTLFIFSLVVCAKENLIQISTNDGSAFCKNSKKNFKLEIGYHGDLDKPIPYKYSDLVKKAKNDTGKGSIEEKWTAVMNKYPANTYMYVKIRITSDLPLGAICYSQWAMDTYKDGFMKAFWADPDVQTLQKDFDVEFISYNHWTLVNGEEYYDNDAIACIHANGDKAYYLD